MEKQKKVLFKNFSIGMMLIGAAFAMITVVSENVSATTYTVNNQGGGNFLTITQALAVAVSGDIINVQYGSGTYTENININTIDISIIGFRNGGGVPPTISASNSGQPVVTISAVDTYLECFIITGGTHGIYSNNVVGDYSNEIIATECYINGNSQSGVHILSGAYHSIIYSEIYDNFDGIYALDIDNCHFSHSSIFNNDCSGIYLLEAYYNSIDDDYIYSNGHEGIYIEGDSNDIDGESSGQIYDNNDFYSVTEVFDVEIWGDYNTIESYEVFTTLDVTNRTGIYTHAGSASASNNIYNCEVYGYNGDYSVGIWIYLLDTITGSSTNIHDNTIGVKLGSYNNIDCSNSGYSSINFCDNGVSILITDDDNVIENSYISSTSMYPIGYVGIKTYSNLDSIEISYCKIEIQENGIDIYSSAGTSQSHNDIHDCLISACYYNGIYVYGSTYDHIKDTEITTCYKGVYLEDTDYINIETCSLYDNNGGSSQYTAGIYIDGGSCNEIGSCDFTKHYRNIWLTDTSDNNIHDTTIIDEQNDAITSGTWGQNSVQIGIFVDHSDNNEINKVDFNRIGYCIGIVASTSIDILGDSTSQLSYTAMENVEQYELYAINDGSSISSGTISHYGNAAASQCDAYLMGYDSSTKTDFDHGIMQGTWQTSGNYYNWY